ncbi:copper resistance CopC family protein [Mycetocola zhadangensis]|uniref:copper resistance CopC family protein n=1 Tax=Mycetocola zhadangensis TaxID=1164595 RepID=UPI003A4DF02E
MSFSIAREPSNVSKWLRMIVLVGLTAALAAIFMTVGGKTAQGHDYLASTEPADGATVERPLSEVALTFSDPPLEGLDTGSYISVVSADQRTVSDDNVVIEGSTLSVPVTFATPGAYTVTWQTVSSDGHPISGTYSFEWLSNGEPEPATAMPTPTTTNPSESFTTAPSASPSSEQQGSIDASALFWIVALSVFLILGVVGYLVARARKRQTESSEEAP